MLLCAYVCLCLSVYVPWCVYVGACLRVGTWMCTWKSTDNLGVFSQTPLAFVEPGLLAGLQSIR